MSSHDIYLTLRIFSYRFFELGLEVNVLSHVKKSFPIYFDPEGPYFSEKLTQIVFAKSVNLLWNRWWVTRQTKTQKMEWKVFLLYLCFSSRYCWRPSLAVISVLLHQEKKGLPKITRRLGSLDNVCIKTWSEPEILLTKILSYHILCTIISAFWH